MRNSPARDQREADLLIDVAAAYDAGLTTAQILDGPATASLSGSPARVRGTDVDEPTLTEGLHRKGLALAPHELLLLRTAEQAGTISRALRNIADQRDARANRHRELRRSLAYPAFLMAFGCAVSILASYVTKTSVWIPIAITATLLGGVFLTIHYVLRSVHREDGGNVPLVSSIVRNLGELPYLHSMHGLYSAGVKITEAHELALKTSPIEGVRVRLFEASQALAREATLSEALDRAKALHPETRQILSAAEAAGDLEDALERTIQRRQGEVDRQTRLLTRISIAIILLLVYGYVAYVVLSFWIDYYAPLGRILERR